MQKFRKDLRRILATLESQGISMSDWGEEAGVSRQTVWRILKGKQVPSIETFLALQKAAVQLLPRAA